MIRHAVSRPTAGIRRHNEAVDATNPDASSWQQIQPTRSHRRLGSVSAQQPTRQRATPENPDPLPCPYHQTRRMMHQTRFRALMVQSLDNAAARSTLRGRVGTGCAERPRGSGRRSASFRRNVHRTCVCPSCSASRLSGSGRVGGGSNSAWADRRASLRAARHLATRSTGSRWCATTGVTLRSVDVVGRLRCHRSARFRNQLNARWRRGVRAPSARPSTLRRPRKRPV